MKKLRIEKVQGIVINSTDYSESSKILNVFTKEYGIIGVISKGCRRVKSKLRSVSQKLVYGDFNIYYKENGLSTLISVDVLDNFTNILGDIIKVSYGTFLLELASQVYRENADEQIYNTLISALKKIDAGFDPLVITSIVELKYLDYLGIALSLDGCSICGNTEDIVTLSTKNGGYVCKNCYDNEKIVSDKAIKVIRLFKYVDIDKISKLDLKDKTVKEIEEFLDEYYDTYTGLFLKSKKFLKTLSS